MFSMPSYDHLGQEAEQHIYSMQKNSFNERNDNSFHLSTTKKSGYGLMYI